MPVGGLEVAHVDDFLERCGRPAGGAAVADEGAAAAGAAWSFVALEIVLIGFTLPVFADLWELSGTWLGALGSGALAGSLAGSILLGRAADRIGRRSIFQLSIVWYALFTALTALSTGPEMLLAFRFSSSFDFASPPSACGRRRGSSPARAHRAPTAGRRDDPRARA